MKNVALTLVAVAVLGLSIYLIIQLAPQFLEKIGPKAGLEKFPLAPDFALRDLSGKEIKLADLRGKDIVLSFWTSWNSASIKEIKTLNDYSIHYAPEDIEILAVNSEEDPDAVKKIQTKNSWSLKTLLDTEGEAGELYNIGVLPLTVFIDKSGLEISAIARPLTLQEIEKEISNLHQ